MASVIHFYPDDFRFLLYLQRKYNQFNESVRQGTIGFFKFFITLILFILIFLYAFLIYPLWLNVFGIHRLIRQVRNFTIEDLKNKDKQRFINLLTHPLVQKYFSITLLPVYRKKFLKEVYTKYHLLHHSTFIEENPDYQFMTED